MIPKKVMLATSFLNHVLSSEQKLTFKNCRSTSSKVDESTKDIIRR